MTNRLFFLTLLLMLSLPLFGQTTDFVPTDGITTPLHKANIGKITFMSKQIPIEEYKETDFLTSFELKDTCDLNIRVFLGNSLTNYMHLLAPELPAERLTKMGNYQFSFFVDTVLIYKENLNSGAGSPEYKNTKTILRVPFKSSTNEDSWGRFMWTRFMMSGGEDALSAGSHIVKIEIRPYIKNPDIKVGELIAEGHLQLVITRPIIDERLVEIQTIKPNSGWEISNAGYDKELIKKLNRQIAENVFKQITSIVVVKDGKLLLEEYFNGSTRDSLHDTRSVGKSFASALMGIAIDEGFIKSENQSLNDFYDLTKFSNYSTPKEKVTIKSLLTMSSGFDGNDDDQDSPGNEENMYPTSDWVAFTLNLPMDSSKEIGKNWAYFTSGVVLLGDILNKSIPAGLETYSDKKLFAPLGIRNYIWQFTPSHVPNTAGGLRMNSLDLAKFGQLYENNGIWNEKRIISEQWIKNSLTKHLTLPYDENSSYGYLFWNMTFNVHDKAYETFYASGNGGNKIFIFNDLPLVVVITTTAYNQGWAHPQSNKIIEKYILPAVLE